MTDTTTATDTVAVPRDIALQAIRALEQHDGYGPIVARRLRPYTHPAATVEDRGELLTALAQRRNEHAVTDEYVLDRLAAWAPEVPDAERREFLFDSLRETVHDRDGLESGSLDAGTAFGYTGPGAHDRALDHAQAKVDEALAPLLHGAPVHGVAS